MTAKQRRGRRMPWAIGGGVVGLAAVYATPPVIYSWLTKHEQWGQFWTTAATPYGAATAGFGAILAGSFAYINGREQRSSEKEIADRDHQAEITRDLHSRFTTATQQLADPTNATIQQAGAYALAALADDWLVNKTPQQAQVCIDVLCTYLRTHHLAHVHDISKYNYTKPPADQAVRDTIVRLISHHLQPGTTPSWSKLSYNFTGSHLHDCSFEGARFAGVTVSFDSAVFSGSTATFADAVFCGGEVLFTRAVFPARRVTFSHAEFSSDEVLFASAKFSGDVVVFDESKFTGRRTSFVNATFSGDWTLLKNVQFEGEALLFGSATFSGGRTWFPGTTFAGKLVTFEDTTFTGGQAEFDHATFSADTVRFSKATFSADEVSFCDVIFAGKGEVWFAEPRAWRNVTFDWDSDPTKKPMNVRPTNWPPPVSAADAVAD